jgi:hypothetical protein
VHGSNLTPQERAVLRKMEEHLRTHDAPLVDRLQRLSRSTRPMRFAPWYWAPSTYLILGSVFLLLGIFLAVGSAILGGLALIVLATWRWRDRKPTEALRSLRRRGTGRLP